MGFNCCICLCEYSTNERSPHAPRVLRCGHTFCTSCLIRILETTHMLVCPKCREDSTSVEELPLNKALMQAIESRQKEHLQKRIAAVRTCAQAEEEEKGEEMREVTEKRKPPKVFKCIFPGCGKVFTTKENFVKHIKDEGHAYSSSYRSWEKKSFNPNK